MWKKTKNEAQSDGVGMSYRGEIKDENSRRNQSGIREAENK